MARLLAYLFRRFLSGGKLESIYSSRQLRAADEAYAARDFSVALNNYQKVLAVAPDRSQARYGLGLAALELGRADEAMEAFRRASEATPPHISAALKLGQLISAKRDYAGALKIYKRIVNIAPHLAEAQYGLAIAASELGDDAVAVEAFRKTWDLDRSYVLAGLRLGDTALANKENDTALNLFQQVLDFDHENASAQYGWAVAALELGRADEALASFAKAFSGNHPPILAGLKLGKLTLAKGEPQEALDIFRRVLDLAPEAAEAHYGWGASALALGRIDEATAAFQRALNITPPDPEAGLRLAEMALAKRENAAALALYRRVLDIAPYLAEAHYGYGVLTLEAGDVEEARAAFHRAWQANGTHVSAGLRLAELTLATGDNAIAREIYERLLNLAPSLPEVHYGLGIAALEDGKFSDATAAFARALELKPDYFSASAAASFLSLFPQRSGPAQVRGDRPLICIPILPFSRNWLGGQIYLLNFARIMSSLPKSRRPRIIVAVLMNDWQQVATLRQVVDKLFECAAVFGIFDSVRRAISLKPEIHRYAKRMRVTDDWTKSLFERVDWTYPVLYPSWGTRTVPGPLYWIPDLQHRFWPEFFGPLELASRHRDLAALSEREVPIIFSSFDAQAHFRKFYPNQKCRTHVWHFCTLSDAEPTSSPAEGYESLGLPERFYCIANQFWPHKDHTTLFRALRKLLDAGHDITFACTGTNLANERDSYSQSLLELIEKLSLGRNLRLLGVLPRSQQVEIMRRACAVIQPSLFEGWSTVVEDARALGRPLIVSDIPVHREQAPEDSVFFMPQNSNSLAAAVLSLDSRLMPGPDLDREAVARVELHSRAKNSADQFLKIIGTEIRINR